MFTEVQVGQIAPEKDAQTERTAGSADEIVPTETQLPQQATEVPTTPRTQPEETKPTTPPETTPTNPPETTPYTVQPQSQMIPALQ